MVNVSSVEDTNREQPKYLLSGMETLTDLATAMEVTTWQQIR